MYLFNVRVYGILINQENEVLVSDEQVGNFCFTKFPGGGLEYGEGLLDALKREYLEECNLEIDIVQHLYTTDFFEKSSFNDSQIISIYYLIRPKSGKDLTADHAMFMPTHVLAADNPDKEIKFRLVAATQDITDIFTFRTDKAAWDSYLNWKTAQRTR
ncbi:MULTISPECIES: NUDIX domain-containing protein [Sphingobacterium]|uniref:NUDIX domain-containing protein n=1 Tax=Sphingobacterium populi TaxID=1812824 RepID=A0ABW5U7Y1_9SPHI|nr:NUDIX hydrolase [Sphingobacterium sp. CFCC 11742]